MFKFRGVLKSNILIFIIFVIAVGCSRVNVSQSEDSSTKLDTPFATNSRLNTAISTRTKAPTWTFYLSATTPPPTFTMTPLQTLSDDQANIQMQKWITGYAECALPCWGGILIGKTNWGEAKQILNPVVNILSIDENYPCSVGNCYDIEWTDRRNTPIRGFVYGSSKILQSSFVNKMVIEGLQTEPIYRISNILEKYGTPDRILLSTSTFLQPKHSLPFEVIIVYQNSKILIVYNWTAMLSGENIIGCLNDNTTTLVITANSMGTDPEIVGELQGSNEGVSFQPLDKVTTLTYNDFYTTFRFQQNNCIVTPAKYWY
jgi:hypothetical protein